jgi:hypothetical protein
MGNEKIFLRHHNDDDNRCFKEENKRKEEERKKGRRGECEKIDTGVIGKEAQEIVKRHITDIQEAEADFQKLARGPSESHLWMLRKPPRRFREASLGVLKTAGMAQKRRQMVRKHEQIATTAL